MKVCAVCDKEFPEDHFLPGKKTCQKCREYAKAYNKARYEQQHDRIKAMVTRRRIEHAEHVNALRKKRYQENPAYRESARRWAANHPERIRIRRNAGKKVLQAIKNNTLIRPSTCEECGVMSSRIEAAHYDYSRPLDVRWLCRRCHVRWDQQDPKTISTG